MLSVAGRRWFFFINFSLYIFFDNGTTGKAQKKQSNINFALGGKTVFNARCRGRFEFPQNPTIVAVQKVSTFAFRSYSIVSRPFRKYRPPILWFFARYQNTFHGICTFNKHDVHLDFKIFQTVPRRIRQKSFFSHKIRFHGWRFYVIYYLHLHIGTII